MSEIISAAVLLILIMDPLGNLPIFMSVLKHTEPKRRRAIMIRELLIALLVMFIFLFAGEKILAFLNLRAETVSKTGVGATPPGVQIPLSPPKFNHLHIIKSVTKITLGITWNIFLEYFQVTGHQVLVKL